MISDVYSTVAWLASTPFQWLVLLMETIWELLSDRLAVAILSFLLGMFFLLALQAMVLWKIFRDQPVNPPPTFKRTIIKFPEVLRSHIDQDSLKKKEDCVWLNFLTQFIFAELKDSVNVHRFLTKKIHKEFEEVLTSRTGVFVDELFLRDFNLGDKFPVFVEVFVDKCDMKKDIIETLSLRASMSYDGGFQIAIDAALPFGRTAFISVKVMKLKGDLRFQFSSLPFCHWSVSFYEEPEIELDVSAQLDGRPMSRLKNIIASQIRKTLRKKHTLPMYKMRYKPFFPPKVDKPLGQPQNLLIDGIQIGSGILEVSIVGASRLPVINKDAKLYCTISVDDLPWKQLVTQERSKKPVLRKELVKHSSDQSLGLTVKDELVPDRLHPVVVVEHVMVGSPTHLSGIKEGDIIISVSGNKVSSAKQATKFLRSAKDKVSLQVETSVDNNETKVTRSDERIGRRFSDQNTDGGDFLSDFVNIQSNLGASASTSSVPTTLKSSSNKSKKWDVRKTRLISSISNPSWNQKFIFTIQPNISYLNICVWSHGGDRSTRSDVIGSSSQDILIGHASLNLDDILLHCLVTLSGTLHDKVRLKHGQYQTEAELTKEWASHKGWDPELMYGEMNLAFYFIPSLLTMNQRRSLASCGSDAITKRTDESQTANAAPTGSSPKDTTATSQFTQSSADDSQVYSQGHHQFDSTSFITATFCDYCGKKIWMKEAFKCRTCSMVCHKKCLVKCLVNTFCTDGGVKKRSALDEKWEPSSKSRTLQHNQNAETSSPRKQATSVDGETWTKQPQIKISTEDSLSLQGHETPNADGSDAEDPKESSFSGRMSSQIDEAPVIVTSSQRSSDISSTFGRFRNLKERTDKIKDNVVRNLKKTKSPAPLSDKDVMEAKDSGAKLFLDLEPAQRKDKLDELITHSDEQLKMEMKNKESLERELATLTHDVDSGSVLGPVPSKKRSEMRALKQKVTKSTEKLDAMRLLMLQYCTALQHCINVLELDEEGQISDSSSSLIASSHGSRVSYMGGFVKRASFSVKEKMSSIRKDFGKKGTSKPSVPSQTLGSRSSNQTEGRNNNRLLTTIFDGLSTKETKGHHDHDQGAGGSKRETGIGPTSEGDVPDKHEEGKNIRSRRRESLTERGTLLFGEDGVTSVVEQRSNSLPRIQVHFGDDFKPDHFGEISEADDGRVKNDSNGKLKNLGRMDSKIARSNSDSHLEINKTANLHPNDILRYHGNSVPKILVSDDDNSESDYLVIDSSDENDLSDFYEDDRFSYSSHVAKIRDSPPLNIIPKLIMGGQLPPLPAELKDFAVDGEKREDDNVGEDEESMGMEHRGLPQDCHSYVV